LILNDFNLRTNSKDKQSGSSRRRLLGPAPETEAAPHVQISRLAIEGPTRGMPMSDGFHRIVETFGLMSDA
jgi:hypothetical protein